MTRFSILSLLLIPALTPAALPGLTAVAQTEWDELDMVHGVIDQAFRYESANADFVLVLSRTGNFPVPPEEGREQESARLFSTLLREDGDETDIVWRSEDVVDACALQITAEFAEPAAFVSDADGDGEPEFWVAHRLACRIDVSPATQKLIGHEGKQAYELQGTTRISLDTIQEGGEAEPDAALKAAPLLLKHAQGLWLQVRDEAFE